MHLLSRRKIGADFLARMPYGVNLPAFPPGFSAPVALVGDKALRRHSRVIEKFGTEDLVALIEGAFSALRERRGSSLSAVQIGIPVRVIVWDLPGRESERRQGHVVNPEITETGGNATSALEGCLSLPGARASVVRWDTVTVEGRDVDGNHITLHADGLWARRLQHEIDHLGGRLYIDLLQARERRHVLRVVERRLGARHVLPGCG